MTLHLVVVILSLSLLFFFMKNEAALHSSPPSSAKLLTLTITKHSLFFNFFGKEVLLTMEATNVSFLG